MVSVTIPSNGYGDHTHELLKKAEEMAAVLKDGTCLVGEPTVYDENVVEFEIKVYR